MIFISDDDLESVLQKLFMYLRTYKSSQCSDSCPYDLAVLEVSEPFPINDFIRPACLPKEGWTSNLKNGRMVISGMGMTNPQIEQRSSTLKIATIPMHSKSQCKQNYNIQKEFNDSPFNGNLFRESKVPAWFSIFF